ncbi:hypothetical protein CEXT_74101 [Caerostris extrusa]|uniref:Uncharacterized protein n=1 Tax=Caerostris extrusa TaxID=172846 RepID=A0AAV4XT65_CAEEX|nr:hypothetical protein CEXT_74101 [Caerostris extrusa]
MLQDSMWKLKKLKLSYNLIQGIAPNMFSGFSKNIDFLYLDHCLIREIDAQIWNEFFYMEELDLSFNLIDKVTNNNNITNIKDRPIENSLRLDHNLFTSLGPALRYHRMWNFSMAHNLIAHLGPEDIQGERRVRHLDLQGNVITQVERLTFARVRGQLLSLDLSRNRIKSRQGCLQSLTRLETLNLSHNRIENPRGLKWGAAHNTKQCPATDKINNPTCINCGQTGHLAAWRGCPKFPKPRIPLPLKILLILAISTPSAKSPLTSHTPTSFQRQHPSNSSDNPS